MNYRVHKILSILILLQLIFLWKTPAFGMPSQISDQMEVLNQMGPEQYSESISKVRKRMVNLLRYEKEQCQTKFRPPRGTRSKKRAELAKQLNQCFLLVKEWTNEYHTALNRSKKRYLLKVHKDELLGIDQIFEVKKKEDSKESKQE